MKSEINKKWVLIHFRCRKTGGTSIRSIGPSFKLVLRLTDGYSWRLLENMLTSDFGKHSLRNLSPLM